MKNQPQTAADIICMFCMCALFVFLGVSVTYDFPLTLDCPCVLAATSPAFLSFFIFFIFAGDLSEPVPETRSTLLAVRSTWTVHPPRQLVFAVSATRPDPRPAQTEEPIASERATSPRLRTVNDNRRLCIFTAMMV